MPSLAWLGIAVVAVAFAYGEVQGRNSLRGYLSLARRFRERHGHPHRGNGSFVSLTPNTDSCVYDGFTSWDVGLLSRDDEALRYSGDGVSFSLFRTAITDIHLTKTRLTISPMARIELHYQTLDSPDGQGTIAVGCVEVRSVRAANRATRALYEQLSAWHRDAVDDRQSPNTVEEAPPILKVRGVRARDWYRWRQFLLVSILVFAAGCSMGMLVGLSPEQSLAASPWGAGLAAAAGVGVRLLPVWWWARRPTTDNAPPPE